MPELRPFARMPILLAAVSATAAAPGAYTAFPGPGPWRAHPIQASVPVGGIQLIHDGPSTTVSWGDIDGDGDQDLFVAEGGKDSGGYRILAWYEFEASNWVRHDLAPAIGPFTGDSSLADIDGDGDLDVAISVDQHSVLGPASVFWYENDDPFGTWMQHVMEAQVPGAFHIGDMDSGDVDDDGKMDVVIRHLSTKRFVVYFQNGPDDWTPRRMSALHREGLKLADLDHDGKLDIIANGYVLFAPAQPRTGPWQSVDIDAAYHSLPEQGLNNSTKAGVTDFNGDGRPDILFSVAEGAPVQLAWYEAPLSPRTGAWIKHTIESPQTNNHQAEIADFDLDGDPDVLGGFAFEDSGVHWWENLDGDGLAWTRRSIDCTVSAAEQGCYSCQSADFDGDGDVDYAGPSTYSNAGKVYLYENRLVAAPRPAYDVIQAEAADERTGVGIYTIGAAWGGGLKIGSIHDGEWIGFDAIGFAPSLAHKVTVRVASNNVDGGTIRLRLDAPDGTEIGMVAVPFTGGWDSFVEITVPIAWTGGVHPLYLVFQGGSGALLDVDHLRFKKKLSRAR